LFVWITVKISAFVRLIRLRHIRKTYWQTREQDDRTHCVHWQ